VRGRPPSTTPTKRRNITISLDLWAEMDLLLYSPLEGRIPEGMVRRFIESAIRAKLTEVKGTTDGRYTVED